MSNMRMLIENDYDDATLTLERGTEAGAMHLANTQLYGNELRFVSTDTDEVVITGNFEIARLLSGFVLYRHNLGSAAKVRLEIFDSLNQSGKTVYDSGKVNTAKQRTFGEWDWRIERLVSSPFDNWEVASTSLWFSEVFGLSFRITLNDPGNDSGELEVTRIYLGRAFTPSFNFSWGQKMQLASGSKQVRTDGASLYTKVRKQYRKIDLKLSLNDTDRPHFYNALTHVGTHRDFFISLYPGANDQRELEHAFAGKFKGIPSLVHASHNRTTTTIQIEEC